MIYKTSRERPIRMTMDPFIWAVEWLTEVQNIYFMANPAENLLCQQVMA